MKKLSDRRGLLQTAVWRPRLNPALLDSHVQNWLVDRQSLTRKLIQHSQKFQVKKLHQRKARMLNDEALAISISLPGRIWEREVLLICDDQPVVFGHSIVPLQRAFDWPHFAKLGSRSLGSTLFNDPLVKRSALQFARLYPSHPLARRAQRAIGESLQSLVPASPGETAGEIYPALNPTLKPALNSSFFWARRCLFQRKSGLMLVTEVLLPACFNLSVQTR